MLAVSAGPLAQSRTRCLDQYLAALGSENHQFNEVINFSFGW